jgi:hypothetical protein
MWVGQLYNCNYRVLLSFVRTFIALSAQRHGRVFYVYALARGRISDELLSLFDVPRVNPKYVGDFTIATCLSVEPF